MSSTWGLSFAEVLKRNLAAKKAQELALAKAAAEAPTASGPSSAGLRTKESFPSLPTSPPSTPQKAPQIPQQQPQTNGPALQNGSSSVKTPEVVVPTSPQNQNSVSPISSSDISVPQVASEKEKEPEVKDEVKKEPKDAATEPRPQEVPVAVETPSLPKVEQKPRSYAAVSSPSKLPLPIKIVEFVPRRRSSTVPLPETEEPKPAVALRKGSVRENYENEHAGKNGCDVQPAGQGGSVANSSWHGYNSEWSYKGYYNEPSFVPYQYNNGGSQTSFAHLGSDIDFQHAHYSAAFYGNGGQYYQPIAEINTRNGPLLVNPLMYPFYDAFTADTSTKGMSNGNRLSPHFSNGDSTKYNQSSAQNENGQQPVSPVPSVIKSFYFGADYTGLIIGRNGASVRDLRQKYNCEVWIDEQTRRPGLSTLHMHGFEEYVDAAADTIRRRLENHGGELQPLAGIQSEDAFRPYIMRVELPHGVTLDAFVAHVEPDGIVFVQIPGHPSFHRLSALENQLSVHCADGVTSPFIDIRLSPVEHGCYVAAPMNDSSGVWLRAVVISRVFDGGEIQLRSLDHGFVFSAPSTGLKQLLPEFCSTPIQAVECRIVHGRYNPEKPLSEQINRGNNSVIGHKWVRVKAMARELETDLPVVEMMVPVGLVAPQNQRPPSPAPVVAQVQEVS